MLSSSVVIVHSPVLLCVVFYTLAERQVMASLQHRWGPQVTGLGGACQSFWDGLKNMFKQPILPEQSGMGALIASPCVALLLSQLGWCGLLLLEASFQAFMILAAGGLTVYAVMLSGWSSNSAYGFLGCWRTLALMLSYELCLGSALLGLGVIYVILALRCAFLDCSTVFLAPLLCSLHFVLFFIAEYASMAVMSALASVFFFGGLQVITLTALICTFILTRGCLPRYRYDQFMRLGWKAFLPLSLAFFSFYASCYGRYAYGSLEAAYKIVLYVAPIPLCVRFTALGVRSSLGGTCHGRLHAVGVCVYSMCMFRVS